MADRMKLADWTFRLLNQPAAEGSFADISCAEKRKAAVVRVCPQFHEIDPDEQRHTICHELIHAHLHPIHSAVTDLEGILGHEAYRVFYDRFIEALEYAVDGIADAFAPTLPTLPEASDTARDQRPRRGRAA